MFHVHLPPLRDRRPDIPDLARHLLARAAKRPVEAVADLLTPRGDAGDVRPRVEGERPRTGERDGVRLDRLGRPADRPGAPAARVRHPQIAGSVMPRAAMPTSYSPPSSAMPATVPFPTASAASGPSSSMKSLADVEMEYILQVYAKNNMNKQATATELGISLKTLYNKLHKYEEERRMRAG